jgi:hypothetical protein
VSPRGFLSAALRPGHPDLLDLPWGEPFARWAARTNRVEARPRGDSRNPVLFVGYDGASYALKSLAPGRAEREYDLLRAMRERRLPVVEPIGHVRCETEEGERSVLVTRYLEHALPYATLFTAPQLARYQAHLLSALAGLLVELHLAGVYWGDCSLANTLFLRDAGRLSAFLVDAETSHIDATVPDALRREELEIVGENVYGGLLDLVAFGALPRGFAAEAMVDELRRRYAELWDEVTAVETMRVEDRYRVEDRVRRLNALGFSVGELELVGGGDGRLRVRVQVTDRSYHRDLLHSLTGLDAQENQAEQLLNTIQQHKITLGRAMGRSGSLGMAAHHWLEHEFRPITHRLADALGRGAAFDPVEAYCQLLEHKWFLSEQADRDVGLDVAIADFVARFGPPPG